MAPTVPFYTRVIMSSVQTVLTACLLGIYFQSVIPIPGFTIPAWNLWILSVGFVSIDLQVNFLFENTCIHTGSCVDALGPVRLGLPNHVPYTNTSAGAESIFDR
jgi:hypothetical protein